MANDIDLGARKLATLGLLNQHYQDPPPPPPPRPFSMANTFSDTPFHRSKATPFIGLNFHMSSFLYGWLHGI